MKIVLTPDWFLGNDVLIAIFSFLVLLTFFILCLKNYNFNKKKTFLYLGIGFFLISLAQLAEILTKLVLYYDTTVTQQIGEIIVTQHILKSVDIFYYIGFFFHKILTLLGLFIIYKIPDKKIRLADIVIAVYLIILTSFVGSSVYFVYHLSVFLFLLLIIGNYYHLWKKNKNPNTKILLNSFGVLAAGYFLSALSNGGIIYVLGDLTELVSYIMLLYLIIRIIRTGKN